jgi:hypothetical protein
LKSFSKISEHEYYSKIEHSPTAPAERLPASRPQLAGKTIATSNDDYADPTHIHNHY